MHAVEFDDRRHDVSQAGLLNFAFPSSFSSDPIHPSIPSHSVHPTRLLSMYHWALQSCFRVFFRGYGAASYMSDNPLALLCCMTC